ncbi:cohesin domain-containing protein, partial [Methylobacterium crusticola]|uniref:cohesin domain-containing protein n=1 Tax=Methylobacterium crusticola TaxID=1697972 RepID=UPI001EE3771D
LLWDIRPPSAANAAVRLVPPTVPCPPVGEQLTLSLQVENGENVSAYQATVNFDPAALRFVEATAGNYLPQGAFFLPPVV